MSQASIEPPDQNSKIIIKTIFNNRDAHTQWAMVMFNFKHLILIDSTKN